MDIIDFSKFSESTGNSKHAPCFPRTIFCVIAGATGCGKTNLIANFLLQPQLLDYSNVYVYSPTLHQATYKHLKQYFETAENNIKKSYGISVKIANFFDGDEEIKDPSKLDPHQNHVMIFDDVMNSDQTKIKDYFCRGRHNNVNVFYLCQSLHKIQKHCIRENVNVFVLFKQDDKTLKYFHETYLSGDMDFKEFKTFCDEAWSKKYGFVVINLWEEACCGRYVGNYKYIYTPLKYLK